MRIKQKRSNAVSAHPKLAAFAIGLALTLAVWAIIGTLEQTQAFAHNFNLGSNTASQSAVNNHHHLGPSDQNANSGSIDS